MPQLLVSEQSLLAKNLCLKHIDFNLSRSWAGPAHAPQQQPRLAVRRDHLLAQPHTEGVPAGVFVHRDPVTVTDTNVELLITVRLVVRGDTHDPLVPQLLVSEHYLLTAIRSIRIPLDPLTLCVASPDLL